LESSLERVDKRVGQFTQYLLLSFHVLHLLGADYVRFANLF
jgi:hypothetical protein